MEGTMPDLKKIKGLEDTTHQEEKEEHNTCLLDFMTRLELHGPGEGPMGRRSMPNSSGQQCRALSLLSRPLFGNQPRTLAREARFQTSTIFFMDPENHFYAFFPFGLPQLERMDLCIVNRDDQNEACTEQHKTTILLDNPLNLYIANLEDPSFCIEYLVFFSLGPGWAELGRL